MDFIQIGYKTYKIIYKEDVYDDNNNKCYGIADHNKQEIIIDNTFSQAIQNQALIHEILHAIADKYLLEVNKNEREIDLLATGIYEMILDPSNIETLKNLLMFGGNKNEWKSSI
mgnify:FL=1